MICGTASFVLKEVMHVKEFQCKDVFQIVEEGKTDL
jgi:hypothetical protein